MITHQIPHDPARLTHDATHLLIAIDVSGSMSSELPLIRPHVQDALPKLVRPGDRVSILWFSGRGECGRLANAEPINGLSSLAELNRSIDRWLQPVGLTSFQDPLDLLLQTVHDCRARSDWHGRQHVQFLSDGHDNQSSRADVLRRCAELGKVIEHATVIEYGHYADRRMLSDMATALGGSLTFAQDFQAYAPEFDAFLTRPPGRPRRTVSLGHGLPDNALILAVNDGEILTFTPDHDHHIRVPGDVQRVSVIAPGMTAPPRTADDLRSDTGDLLYAAISVAASRMDGQLTETLLQASGDARLLGEYRTVLGKQRFAEFAEQAKQAAFDPALRLQHGQDFSIDLNADTLSVLEVIDLLAHDQNTRLRLQNPAFSYSRIGPARVTAAGATGTEQARIQALSAEIAAGNADPAALTTLQEELQNVQARVQAGATFTADPTDGLPLSGLVWNRDLPNLSVRTTRNGTVSFAQVPDGLTLPAHIPTRQVRTYAVIKDGLVNISVLPVRLGRATHLKLRERGLTLQEWNPDATYHLPLGTLPVVSRSAAAGVSLTDLAQASGEMVSLQGSLKVYNDLLRRHFPAPGSQALTERYGEDEAAWLRAMGLTDHGFNPPSTEIRTGDVRPTTEFKVSLKGLSSLPKVSDIEEKRALGKPLTPVMTLLEPALRAHDTFLTSSAYTQADETTRPDLHRAWLDNQIKAGTSALQALEFRIARSKFALIVGQRWFTDSSGPEDHTRSVTIQPGLLPGETGTAAIHTTATAELRTRDLPI